MNKIVIIGSGNVASHLALALTVAGNEIIQVYSRDLFHAQSLAQRVDEERASLKESNRFVGNVSEYGAQGYIDENGSKSVHTEFTDQLELIAPKADFYIFSIKDDALIDVLINLPALDGICLHTAGSVPMDIFSSYTNKYGVLYPLQTFNKERNIDFSEVPIFIEASNQESQLRIQTLALGLSQKIYILNSDKRKYLHLAAVFACNFTNHMYTLSSEILEQINIDSTVLEPLIEETARKIKTLHPKQAQTGPAVRYDENVIKKHIDLIQDEEVKQLYQLISQSIHKHNI